MYKWNRKKYIDDNLLDYDRYEHHEISMYYHRDLIKRDYGRTAVDLHQFIGEHLTNRHYLYNIKNLMKYDIYDYDVTFKSKYISDFCKLNTQSYVELVVTINKKIKYNFTYYIFENKYSVTTIKLS